MTITATRTGTFVCCLDQLTPELGCAALIDDCQVAVFRLSDGRLFAVQNLDPFSGAHVMSRGITGSRGDEPTIASPIYKQVFSLVTGACLDPMDKVPLGDTTATLETYSVVVADGQVFIDIGRQP